MQDTEKACKFWKLKKGDAIFLVCDHNQVSFGQGKPRMNTNKHKYFEKKNKKVRS
jgi:hypothetical protein